MSLSTNTQDLENSKFREVNTGTATVGVTLDAKIAGEDLTNDVMKVEERYSYAYSAAVGTTAVKPSAGFLHGIFLGVPSAGGNIVIYDSASGTNSNVIGQIGTAATVGFYQFNVSAANGIVVANVGTQTYTAVYR